MRRVAVLPANLALLVVARSLVEAVPLAIAASLLARAFGRVPAPLETWVDTSAAVAFWASIGPLLASVRGRTAVAGLTTIAAAAMAAAAVGGVVDPAWIAAALGGALYGALIVWRGLGIAGSAASWRASAFAGLAATLALALGAFALAAKGALALLAVLGGGAAVVALSVSRGTEETFAASRSGPAKTLPGSAAAILVGFGAIVAALALPTVGALLGVAAEAVAPFVHALIVLIVTPFVYLVDALIRALLPLFRDFRLDLPRILLPRGTPIDDEETVRLLHAEAEVFLERFAIALALVLIAVLIARVVVARALVARADGPLERESVAGEGLAALLGSLFARRAAVRPARPRGDDPHSRVRRAYWDFLALAERGGGGWRAAPQTPREHLAGLSGDAWLVAGDVIAPFEESRYAERASEADADRAEQALREIERELAARA